MTTETIGMKINELNEEEMYTLLRVTLGLTQGDNVGVLPFLNKNAVTHHLKLAYHTSLTNDRLSGHDSSDRRKIYQTITDKLELNVDLEKEKVDWREHYKRLGT